MRIVVTRTISMGHRLPSYDGICSSPHGHNVEIEAQVRTGAVFVDFKEVDAVLRMATEDMDHAMVLHYTDPFAKPIRDMGFRHVLLTHEPTTENIARYIYDEMAAKYTVLCVTVYETAKYSAIARDNILNVRRVFKTKET